MLVVRLGVAVRLVVRYVMISVAFRLTSNNIHYISTLPYLPSTTLRYMLLITSYLYVLPCLFVTYTLALGID